MASEGMMAHGTGMSGSADLCEEMAFDPLVGIARLDDHLARIKTAADARGIPFDRHEARNELQAATFRAGPSRVRLLLSPSGALAIELRPLASGGSDKAA